MKASFEKITISDNCSFVYKYYGYTALCSSPFWHYHPEYELVYIHNGRGRRQIGKHISYYKDGDFLLLGPGLPHMPFGNQEYEDNFEVVIQFDQDFLTRNFSKLPEFDSLRALFERSGYGLSFHPAVKQKLVGQLLAMKKLDGFPRLMAILEVLYQLAQTQAYDLLGVEELVLEKFDRDYDRVNKVYEYVAKHYEKDIELKEAAALCNLSVNSFCRFFKKVTAKTFFSFLNEYRIQKASELLVHTEETIAFVSLECGFNDISYFSRQFKKYKNMSATQYRSNYRVQDKSVKKHSLSRL